MDIFSDSKKDLREAEQRLEDGMINEIASSGNQKSGSNQITNEIRKKAIELAESPKGLDIAAFQKKHNISVMNVDELLKG